MSLQFELDCTKPKNKSNSQKQGFSKVVENTKQNNRRKYS